MRKLTFLFLFLALATAMVAQAPANDDCAGLIDLGIAPTCPTTVFSNVGATNSNIGFDNAPTCFNGGLATRDVWFSFTCPDTLFDFRITLTGVGTDSILNPQFAVYRGDCQVDGLAELLCGIADIGESSLFLDLQGLTPGVQYFIRVSDYSVTAAPNSGDFTLCVAPIPPSSNIDDGGSTLCEGVLYDSGGADGDYSPNENNVFTICPGQPSGCITFTLEYYNLEGSLPFLGGSGDQLYFYDGPDINSPVLAALDGNGFSQEDIAGGGGVCFKVQATSGCMTVQFTSNQSVEQEGWKGHWACSQQPCPPSEQVSVDTTIVAQDIINAVATAASTVTVTNIDCNKGAYGTFNFATDNNDLGLQKGLILTSGSASNIVGPNNDAGGINATSWAPFGDEDPGDPDLDYLSAQEGSGAPSKDVCIVELDVFAATNELTFEYVFGSDEYPEFINNLFNDIFAFLVSGPGITGDPNLSNNAKNIAVLPGTATPVQINSVNNLTNWQYYRNNELSSTLQYDGLTSDYLGVKKSLTARTDVIPCNTYHLKLAVADRQDEVYDSGVFISEIKGGTPNLAVQFASGINYFIEDCSGNEDQLVISLSDPLDQVTNFTVTVGGTATQGVDYILNIPNVITFQPGETQLSFPIFPVADNLSEGTETITITLSNNFGCGTVNYKTISIDLRDNVQVVVAGGDTLIQCAGNQLQLVAEGAQNYFWAPPGAVSNPFIANPKTNTLTQDTWLVVTGTVGTCVDIDSVYIKIVEPSVTLNALADTSICQGTGVPLQVVNNINNSGLTWSPTAGLNNPNSPNPIASPSLTTKYTVSVSVSGCTVSDQITINVDTLFTPTVLADTTVCQNFPVQIANVLNTTTTYQWTPSQGLSDVNSSGPVALPDQTTLYTLVSNSANGYCTQTQTANVTVIPADVNIVGDTYRPICLGDTTALSAQSSPIGAEVVWSPAFVVSSPTGSIVSASPDESVTVFATYTINGCVVRDSVQLHVDSLPIGTITLQPAKPIYCPGDTVYLISPTYEPASFPDITHNWLQGSGAITPLENWNLVMIASETQLFVRSSINNACSVRDSVLVPVGVIPTLVATAQPDKVCPGFPTQITLTVSPAQKIEWMEDPTLSCMDCLTPIATPLSTTTYSVSTPDASCPGGTSIEIVVLPQPALNTPNAPTICPGESILLNTIDQTPDVTYTWTSTPPGFVSTSATPTVTPTQTTTYKILAEGAACDSERDITVTVAQAQLDAGADQTICAGSTAILQAGGAGSSPLVFTWSGSSIESQAGNTAVVRPLQDASYIVQLLYGPNCALFDSLRVIVKPVPALTPIIGTPSPDDTICAGTPIVLKTSVLPAGTPLVWDKNGTVLTGSTGDSITISLGESESGLPISVSATLNGCSVTSDPISYNVKRCVDIPNAFTPGNDDINETFGIVVSGGSVVIEEFTIFNRWGQKVFTATAEKQKWDGKNNGEDAAADVYAYHIRLRFPDGKTEDLKGDVTLLR